MVKREQDSGPRRRRATVRLTGDVARRVRDGHPWIFEDALRGRSLALRAGEVVDVSDPSGRIIARALFDPAGPLALRVFTRDPDARLDVRSTVARAAAWRLRHGELDLGPGGCARLLNGDSEGLPAVNVDRFGDFLVVCCYSAVAEPIQDELVSALVDHWRPRGIYLQRRYQAAPDGKARPGATLLWGAAAPPEVVVREGRLRFAVDVTAPLGTGLFADMRLGRRSVASLAPGRRVLNCFSYTGAFSVAAAAHGATQVVSVDAAARAHTRACRNFALNGLQADDPAYEFVTGDAFAVLARYAARGRCFELVIIDPPTFSTSKRGRTFTALKDYGELAAAAAAVLVPGGVLCAASNTAKLTFTEFDRALGRAADLAGRSLLVTDHVGQPPDYPVLPGFPEGRYLKFLVARVE